MCITVDIFRFLTWIVNSPTTCTCTCYAGGDVELVGVLVGGHASFRHVHTREEGGFSRGFGQGRELAAYMRAN